MSDKIRLKIKLSPGNSEVPITTLIQQLKGLVALSDSIAKDIGIEGSSEALWSGANFKSSSFMCDMVFTGENTGHEAINFNNTFAGVLNYSRRKSRELFHISQRTVNCALDLSTKFAEEEKGFCTVKMPGKTKTGKDKVKHIKFSRENLAAISELKIGEQTFSGSIMGVMHSWTSGGDPPFLVIRDSVSNALVNCYYMAGQRHKILELFSRQDAIIVAYGTLKFDVVTGKSELRDITDFEFAPEFSEEAYHRFFGMLPDITDGLDAASYIRGIRGGD